MRKYRPRHLNIEHKVFTLSDVDITGMEVGRKIEYKLVEEMKTQCEFNLMAFFFIVEFRSFTICFACNHFYRPKL